MLLVTIMVCLLAMHANPANQIRLAEEDVGSGEKMYFVCLTVVM